MPRTHQFLVTLTVHTNKINPAATPSHRSATSMTNRHQVVVIQKDGQHQVPRDLGDRLTRLTHDPHSPLNGTPGRTSPYPTSLLLIADASTVSGERHAHMCLRMLSYYISWHMKTALAPILFVDNDKPAAAAKRANPVAPAQRSDEALTKAARKRTDDSTPVHSFTSLLADLATICANQIQPADDLPAFSKITTPTPLQRRAFELLAVSHRHGYM